MKLAKDDTLKYDVEPFDKAIEKCAAVILKYPGSRYADDALFMMGVSYYFKGDYNRALEKLEFFTTNFPNSKMYDDGMYYTGLTYYKLGEMSKAIIALKEAANYRSHHKKAQVMLCYAYYRDGNYREVINIARKLKSERLTRRERLMILNILSECEYKLKEYESALKTLVEIEGIEQPPEQRKLVKLKIASIYLEMEKYEECRNFLEHESDPEFRLLLADLYVRTNDINTAKQIYEEVKKTESPEYAAKAYLELARIAEKEDNLDLAIAYYDSLIPKATSGLLNEAKKKSEILKKIRELTGKTDEPDKAQFSLGELYFVEVKDMKKALHHYENVYRNYPRSKLSPKALYASFWINKMVLKDDSLAKMLFDELLKRYPDTEYVKSAQNLMSGK
ncbi:MAG: tetratricopeptide repeat protein [candidate division WOR-3 bacterium]|nr:tetratricopeptide repeat protein [candidate division WOR-3 bacterium]